MAGGTVAETWLLIRPQPWEKKPIVNAETQRNAEKRREEPAALPQSKLPQAASISPGAAWHEA